MGAWRAPPEGPIIVCYQCDPLLSLPQLEIEKRNNAELVRELEVLRGHTAILAQVG